jgi:hypothetical protein
MVIGSVLDPEIVGKREGLPTALDDRLYGDDQLRKFGVIG